MAYLNVDYIKSSTEYKNLLDTKFPDKTALINKIDLLWPSVNSIVCHFKKKIYEITKKEIDPKVSGLKVGAPTPEG